MGKVSFHIAPVVDHMFNELKSSSKLFADETRCSVPDPGRGKTKTGYLWAIARDERPLAARPRRAWRSALPTGRAANMQLSF